ncbi:hypothetical protein [Ruegeria atlantica]|uniref:hypothetical protein n=1 Tax=Ruegeria atlantica TaxID=81569 RepID=UPI00147E366C|nr:hypothetical protein [Ruegeria atlantica]
MKSSIRKVFLAVALKCMFVTCAFADQWGSGVLAHCYQLDDNAYKQHLFVRVFWTELGSGQLFQKQSASEGSIGLYGLSQAPVSCQINGKSVVFETYDYRPASLQGSCAQCEHAGFRIIVDGKILWQAPAPESRGDPIFNGTIDMDRDMLRVCEEVRPEDIGVDIAFEQDFFKARTSVLVCSTMGY